MIMKNTPLALGLLMFAMACNSNSAENKTATLEVPAADTAVAAPIQDAVPVETQASAFNPESVPVSEAALGNFPYFELPEGYTFTDPNRYHGEGLTKDYDKEYFLVNGTYRPIEGKSYKAVIRLDDKAQNKTFSELEISKSFDQMMMQVGGVKVNNNEPLKNGERDQLNSGEYEKGYLHSSSTGHNLNTWLIRRPESQIWIQFDYLDNSSRFAVVETKALASSWSLKGASEIQNELNSSGKAILYINFDTDKASLQPAGLQQVAEIAKMLKENPDIKLLIEGHTDNAGTAAHNLQLSEQRAEAVKQALVNAQVDGNRLKTKGHGAEKPVSDNTTPQGMAKNRRVELIRI